MWSGSGEPERREERRNPRNAMINTRPCVFDNDRPRKIVRQALRKPEGEIRRSLEMMQLRFKEWE